MVCIQFGAMLKGSASQERKEGRTEGRKEGRKVGLEVDCDISGALEKHRKASHGRKDRITQRERWKGKRGHCRI